MLPLLKNEGFEPWGKYSQQYTPVYCSTHLQSFAANWLPTSVKHVLMARQTFMFGHIPHLALVRQHTCTAWGGCQNDHRGIFHKISMKTYLNMQVPFFRFCGFSWVRVDDWLCLLSKLCLTIIILTYLALIPQGSTQCFTILVLWIINKIYKKYRIIWQAPNTTRLGVKRGMFGAQT